MTGEQLQGQHHGERGEPASAGGLQPVFGTPHRPGEPRPANDGPFEGDPGGEPAVGVDEGGEEGGGETETKPSRQPEAAQEGPGVVPEDGGVVRRVERQPAIQRPIGRIEGPGLTLGQLGIPIAHQGIPEGKCPGLKSLGEEGLLREEVVVDIAPHQSAPGPERGPEQRGEGDGDDQHTSGRKKPPEPRRGLSGARGDRRPRGAGGRRGRGDVGHAGPSRPGSQVIASRDRDKRKRGLCPPRRSAAVNRPAGRQNREPLGAAHAVPRPPTSPPAFAAGADAGGVASCGGRAQSSALLPSPHIITIRGSKRASVSTRSCCCAITSPIAL